MSGEISLSYLILSWISQNMCRIADCLSLHLTAALLAWCWWTVKQLHTVAGWAWSLLGCQTGYLNTSQPVHCAYLVGVEAAALSWLQLWQQWAPGLDWGQDTTLVTTGDTAHCCWGKGDEEAVQRPDTGQPENMCCLDAEKRKSMFIVY